MRECDEHRRDLEQSASASVGDEDCVTYTKLVYPARREIREHEDSKSCPDDGRGSVVTLVLSDVPPPPLPSHHSDGVTALRTIETKHRDDLACATEGVSTRGAPAPDYRKCDGQLSVRSSGRPRACRSGPSCDLPRHLTVCASSKQLTSLNTVYVFDGKSLLRRSRRSCPPTSGVTFVGKQSTRSMPTILPLVVSS